MKIAYIYANLPQYRKDFFNNLSLSLQNDNIELSVLHGTNLDKKIVKQDNVGEFKRIFFKSYSKKLISLNLTFIRGLYKYFLNNNYDAMVISYMSTNITMLRIVLYCLVKKIPYATWRCGYNRSDYSNLSSKIRYLLISFVEKKAAYNITYGSFYKKELIKKGINSDQIIIAQNTINVDYILKKNMNINKLFSSKTKILFVGAIIKGKLLKSSINAVKKLYDKGYEIVFDIVGDGEILDDLKKYVQKMAIDDIVIFHGPKYNDDSIKYFREADVFLLAGTGGLAINEAMAYGLSIITTNADGTGCDLIDGNGYYMENMGDSELQYEMLKKFINLSDEDKIEMSNRSKEIIKKKASLLNMVNKHKITCENMM